MFLIGTPDGDHVGLLQEKHGVKSFEVLDGTEVDFGVTHGCADEVLSIDNSSKHGIDRQTGKPEKSTFWIDTCAGFD